MQAAILIAFQRVISITRFFQKSILPPLNLRRGCKVKEVFDGICHLGLGLLDSRALTGDVKLQAQSDINIFAGAELFAPDLDCELCVFHKRIVAQRRRIVNKTQKRPAFGNAGRRCGFVLLT